MDIVMTLVGILTCGVGGLALALRRRDRRAMPERQGKLPERQDNEPLGLRISDRIEELRGRP